MAFLFKLRLLNGPLRGRELALPAGELTLGQGDVDLRLPLEGELTEVCLTVSEAGVALSLSVPCWISGKPREPGQERSVPPSVDEAVVTTHSECCYLPLGQVIDIAGQGLILGTAECALPLLSVPARMVAASAPLAASALAVSPLARYYYGRWLTGAAMLLLVTLLGMGGWLFSATATGSSTAEQPEMNAWLTAQLQTPGLVGLTFAWQADGTLRLGGHCQDSQRLNALVMQLRRYGLFLREPVICQDQLLNNVRYVLHLFSYEQAVVEHGSQPGMVVISGAIQADDRWRQVVDMLAVMPGLEAWQVVNQSDEQLKALIAQLRQAALLSKLSVARVSDRLVISGQLAGAQQRKLKAQLAKFSKNWNPAPKIIYQNIRPVETQQQLFPAAIVSVGGSAQTSFIELANGIRLQVGARLPSGYQIVEIDGEHGVELSKEGQLIHVPLDL